MRCNYFLGNHTFQVKNEAVPTPADDQVLVKVMACGICGTEVHICNGEEGSAQVTPPVVLGHEFAGIVEAVGEGVTTLQVGDRVAIDPNIYCGTCRPCRMGKKQNCRNLRALGVTMNGGFEEYALCPEAQCFKMSGEVGFDVLAMTEPLACVLHGIDQANIRTGQTVLVIGGGTIGQMMLQMAKKSGASTVILSEPIRSRREIALGLGADFAIDPIHENLNQRLQQITDDGADVIIECVGKPFTVEQAFSAAAPGTTIVLFGVPAPHATVPLPLFDVYKKELKIVGSMINPDTHQRAANLINSGALQLEALITHKFPLDQLDEAIQMQMSSESIKVVLHPQE